MLKALRCCVSDNLSSKIVCQSRFGGVFVGFNLAVHSAADAVKTNPKFVQKKCFCRVDNDSAKVLV